MNSPLSSSPSKRNQHRGPAPWFTLDRDFASPCIDDLTADREPEPAPTRPRREVRLEDAWKYLGGNTVAVVADTDLDAAIAAIGSEAVLADGDRDLARAGEACILEDVEQDFAQFLPRRQRLHGNVGAVDFPANGVRVVVRCLAFAHRLEGDDIADHGRHVRRLWPCSLVRRRAVPAERARDLIQPVDLGEDAV